MLHNFHFCYKVQSCSPKDVGEGIGSGSESASLSESESAQQSPTSSSPQETVGTGGRGVEPEKQTCTLFSIKKK